MNRKMQIVRRAAEIFMRKGVGQTSMEDIAGAVGIRREGLYYYFKGLGDILLEVILPQSKSLLLNLERIVSSRMTATEALHAAIQSHLDAFNPAYLEMSIALREDHSIRNPEKLRELREVWTEYGDLWVRIVERGQAAGELKPELNAKLVAFGLLGMCNWVSRWYDPSESISIEEIIETFSSMAATGLVSPAQAAGGPSTGHSPT